MSYCNELPRETSEFTRCQSLSDDGDRCRNIAIIEVSIHGDTSTGTDLWIVSNICLECSERILLLKKSRLIKELKELA